MKPLKIIYRNEGMAVNGRTIFREAVRAVAFKGDCLLMVHSTVEGDYKFPGGGVNMGETRTQALIREVNEECGMRVVTVGREIGCVIEYAIPKEKKFDVFKMTSYYYDCQVEDGAGVQSLEYYETELGLTPIWVTLNEAIKNNQKIYQTREMRYPKWLARELFMLEYVKQHK